MTKDFGVMIRLDPSLQATNPASVETSMTHERSANDGAGYHSRGGTSLSGVSAAWRGERGGGSVGGRQSVMSTSLISQSGMSSDSRASSSSQAVIDASRFPAKFAKTLKAVNLARLEAASASPSRTQHPANASVPTPTSSTGVAPAPPPPPPPLPPTTGPVPPRPPGGGEKSMSVASRASDVSTVSLREGEGRERRGVTPPPAPKRHAFASPSPAPSQNDRYESASVVSRPISVGCSPGPSRPGGSPVSASLAEGACPESGGGGMSRDKLRLVSMMDQAAARDPREQGWGGAGAGGRDPGTENPCQNIVGGSGQGGRGGGVSGALGLREEIAAAREDLAMLSSVSPQPSTLGVRMCVCVCVCVCQSVGV